jgi:cbb3-type cytochrome oxidase subunit 3
MLKLYFGNLNSILSTILILVFGVIFWQVLEKRTTITKWGLLVLVLFFLGLFMSMMSGMKDGMNTAASVIPEKHWTMAVLCILGGLAMLAGIVAIFIRRQAFWQINFYLLSAIIIVKTVVTEGYRIYHYFKR